MAFLNSKSLWWMTNLIFQHKRGICECSPGFIVATFLSFCDNQLFFFFSLFFGVPNPFFITRNKAMPKVELCPRFSREVQDNTISHLWKFFAIPFRCPPNLQHNAFKIRAKCHVLSSTSIFNIPPGRFQITLSWGADQMNHSLTNNSGSFTCSCYSFCKKKI